MGWYVAFIWSETKADYSALGLSLLLATTARGLRRYFDVPSHLFDAGILRSQPVLSRFPFLRSTGDRNRSPPYNGRMQDSKLVVVQAFASQLEADLAKTASNPLVLMP